MKYRILLFLCLACNLLSAQIKTQDLMGSWVISKITYKDGAELPDDYKLKHTYVKYTFLSPDKFSMAFIYFENGRPIFFEVKNGRIYVKSEAGYVMNAMRIEELTPEKLVVLQQGKNGFDDPAALKYYFTRESVLQASLPLTGDDIYAVKAGDTVYKESPKIYATYSKEGDLQYYLLIHIGNGDMMHNKSGRITATFTVSKTGVADSLRILESISPEYDKYYTKAFHSVKNSWKPATLNGKHVAVQMLQQMTYLNGQELMSFYSNSRKGNELFNAQKYYEAIFFYDQAHIDRPTDQEILYNRGICKMRLGNMKGACEDWKKIKELGGTQADELLAKYCN